MQGQFVVGIKMRLYRMGKRKILLYSSIPVLFILTAFVLTFHLFGEIPSSDSRDTRSKLVANRIGNRLSENDPDDNYLRFESGYNNDPMEKTYDVDKLLMLGMVKTAADEQKKDEGNRQHAFNVLISDRLSLHRAIPDARHRLCKTKTFRQDLPKASIIICFYNEAWTVLLRTVHSVLDRTPPNLLYEIVLVDDSSELAYLQNRLAQYVWNLPGRKVKLVRTPDRQGLIRARMYGANVATGEVLVFLDSHCEVNTDWLEPLLTSLVDTPRTVAIPMIDIINPDTFEYTPSPLVKGGFNWGLHFRWDQLPDDYFKDEESFVKPIETPTMAGGLFAIQRKYYRDMGEYDSELDTWGGENLEMSFRIWQCGGRLELVPCSRVGHIFRKRRPYGSPTGEDTMTRNSMRVAKVWMDDYIQYFYQVRPEAPAVQYGNISQRLELRKQLKCKPFSWYLKYIYPEQIIPDEKGKAAAFIGMPKKIATKYIKFGLIKHTSTGLCLESEEEISTKKARVILKDCREGDKAQRWHESDQNELVLGKSLCMDVEDTGKGNIFVRLMKCHGSRGTQSWVWSIKNMVFQLYNPASGKCLVPVKKENTYYLTIEICSNNPNSAFKMLER